MNIPRLYNALALTIAVYVVSLPVIATHQAPQPSRYAYGIGVALYVVCVVSLGALLHPRVRTAWLTTRSRIVSGASLLVIGFFVLYPLWFWLARSAGD